MIVVENIKSLLKSPDSKEVSDIILELHEYYDFVFDTNRDNSKGKEAIFKAETCLNKLNEFCEKNNVKPVYRDDKFIKFDLKQYFLNNLKY